jgi:hypothetical protein
MSAISLKDRVAALEAEVAELKARLAGSERKAQPWWELIAGTFAGDPVYEEAMRLGRKWRDSAATRPRKRRKK